MAKTPDNGYNNWLLRIRDDLRARVEDEARQNKRTAPAQMELILCERYNIPVLTNGDKGAARRVIGEQKERKATPRPRRESKKASGTFG